MFSKSSVQKKSVLILLCLVMLFVVFMNNQSSQAASTDRSHIIIKTTSGFNAQFNGGNYRAVTKAMDSIWNSSNSHRFALRTMWLEVNGKNSQSWIENGFVDGSLNNAYYNGFYCAYGYLNNGTLTYGEYPIIGPSTNNDTTHDYHITYLGSQKYAVVVDGTTYKNFTGFNPGGSYMQLGLETNYSGSTFATTYTSIHKTKNGSGVWANWANGVTDINDQLGTGYTCEFTNHPVTAKYYHP